jgi:16S rRNA C967 or C1407 C5-methylase (RsmB/RsmF family)
LKKQPTDLENLTFCSDFRVRFCFSALKVIFMLKYSFLFQIRTGSRLLYDRVIIDAPCTLDASIRHLLIHGKCGWLDESGTVDEHITNLQKRLIYNGARLLAPGGVMVYSTCSFCKGQNEDVVQWLLTKMPNQFELLPLDFPEAGKLIASPSALENCVRFYPKHSGTSGMFISKLRKLKPLD